MAELKEGYNEIGIVSDTHGKMRPEILAHLAHCDAIIHAGDVGHPSVLSWLRTIAPVYAVRGNVDRGAWATELPEILDFENLNRHIRVIHQVDQLEGATSGETPHLVVSGHSHRPSCTRRAGVIYLNPGSIGPRRFKLPIAWATVSFDQDQLFVRAFRIDGALIDEVDPWSHRS